MNSFLGIFCLRIYRRKKRQQEFQPKQVDKAEEAEKNAADTFDTQHTYETQNVQARRSWNMLKTALKNKHSMRHLSSNSATPASQSRDLAFTFPGNDKDTSGSSEATTPPSAPPPGYNPGRRRASMHDAIDLTKIDTRLYDKKLVRQASVKSIEEESQGSLLISLDHNPETSILTAQLVRAHNLMARDAAGTANPYCRLTLLPGQRASAQSRIHRKTLQPYFEEEFIFECSLSDLAATCLHIQLMEYDQFSRDECVGKVTIALSDLDLSQQAHLWRSIGPYEKPKDQRDLGDVMFSMSYLPSAERLTVVVIRARQLRLPDDNKADLNPFIKVAVTAGSKKVKKKKTSTAHNNCSPTWNEALVFNVARESLSAIFLEVTAYHDNKIGGDESIGKVRLSPDCADGYRCQELVRDNSSAARWYTLG